MLWYGSLKIPFVTQAFVLWCRSLRSLFHVFALFCRANIIGYCVTQPKIARIISIVSGVLWWQYATYAFPCIMTKASSGYHMRCAHCACHILEGVWLLVLPKADWDKVCPGKLRVCLWTFFQFYPSRLLSDDMSTVGWSLVKLALLLCCCTCFNK